MINYMCRLWTFFSLLLLCTPALALDKDGRVVIAVVDTGYTTAGDSMIGTRICETGHWDFTSDVKDQKWTSESTPPDDHGHGTHIAGLVHQGFVGTYMNEINEDNSKKDAVFSSLRNTRAEYCIVVLKYYSSKGSDIENLTRTVAAFNKALELKVDIVNYSGGGIMPSILEREAVQALIKRGTIFVAAAGNEGYDLKRYKYYPASYEGVISVGGYEVAKGERVDPNLPDYIQKSLPKGFVAAKQSMSNYGKTVTAWELGKNRLSTLPQGFGFMTGTSQATAIHTGKLARTLRDIRVNDGRLMCSYPYPRGAK